MRSQRHLCYDLNIPHKDAESFSIVHIVAYFGIHQILSELLKMGDIKVDSKDYYGRTPLSRNCLWSCKSSNHNPTADLILHCWAFIYLPTICVVSLFVVLSWLGLAMNNGTFYDRDLAIVITSFAALVVLECILLTHVAVRRQRTARKSRKSCCCVDDACMQTISTLKKNNVAIHQSATFPPEHVGEVQSQFKAQFP